MLIITTDRAEGCDGSPAEILGFNPAGGMDVSRVCCVLSGRGLCDELITGPEESYGCLSVVSVVCCQVEVSATS